MRMLIEAFFTVFTQYGDVRVCGREACSNLIDLANKYFPHKNKDGSIDKDYYGCVKTGIMRTEELLEIRRYLIRNLAICFYE